MTDLTITVLDGKYTFKTVAGDYRIHCLRYAEPWLVLEAGHKAILALMGEIEELRLKLDQRGTIVTEDELKVLEDSIDKVLSKPRQPASHMIDAVEPALNVVEAIRKRFDAR